MRNICTVFILIFLLLSQAGCITITGTAKGIVEDRVLSQIFKCKSLILCLFFFMQHDRRRCKGVDIISNYTQGCAYGNPISDKVQIKFLEIKIGLYNFYFFQRLTRANIKSKFMREDSNPR